MISGGPHFLQIPGPTNVPERVLRAIAAPTIDHRGPDCPPLARRVLDGLQRVFGTRHPVIIYPSSGTGAWEAALVNTLSPGDVVLAADTGHFATLWSEVARRVGLAPEIIPGDWRSGIDPAAVADHLRRDMDRRIKAVMVVHNETSTGIASPVPAVRAALDAAGHPALLLVDTVSSLGALDYRHDEWGVDVAVAASQKGLMLPPGLGFNALSEKALAASRRAGLARAYWDWPPILTANRDGSFPYTPATNLLFGLDTALAMLFAEGLDRVLLRHQRLAEATRRAVAAWGLELQARDPGEASAAVTAVRLPDGQDADALRRLIRERYDMALGAGLGRLRGRVFRIGHLGHFNELMLAGTLAGVELGIAEAGLAAQPRGVAAAMDYLRSARLG